MPNFVPKFTISELNRAFLVTAGGFTILLLSIPTNSRTFLGCSAILFGITLGRLVVRYTAKPISREFLSGTLEDDGPERPMLTQAGQRNSLTGFPGREEIAPTIQSLLDECRTSSRKRFSVLLLNVSRFRSINESLGQATGDRVIREVARRLGQSHSDIDIIGHLGGDEFILILPGVEDPELAALIAEALGKRISAPIRFKRREVYVQLNAGIVVGSGDYNYAEDILRDTNIALGEARRLGSTIVVFEPTMRKHAIERQQIESDLRYAIVCDELEVYYQPIVRLHDGELCGAEALVRWNHPTRGSIDPAEFIPIAESTGLIKPLTLKVLNTACMQLSEWNMVRGNNSPLMVSVNISVTHFGDPNLVGQIKKAIEESAIDPAHLKLEITEGALMDDGERAINTLRQIKDLGVSISIDDFGTGYSSLSYLHKLPIDNLKIDRSFIGAMEGSNENVQIVKTILMLAAALGLSVIAEGIETRTQLGTLTDLGCQFGQGYLFDRPMPRDKMAKRVSREEFTHYRLTSPALLDREPSMIHQAGSSSLH